MRSLWFHYTLVHFINDSSYYESWIYHMFQYFGKGKGVIFLQSPDTKNQTQWPMAEPSARGSDPAQSVGWDSFDPSRPLNTGPRVIIWPLPNRLRFSPVMGPSTEWPRLLSLLITSIGIPSSIPIKELSNLSKQNIIIIIVISNNSSSKSTTTIKIKFFRQLYWPFKKNIWRHHLPINTSQAESGCI